MTRYWWTLLVLGCQTTGGGGLGFTLPQVGLSPEAATDPAIAALEPFRWAGGLCLMSGVDSHADWYWTYCPECIACGSLDLSVDPGADHRDSWGGNPGIWNQPEGSQTMPYSFSDVLASLLVVSGAFLAGVWVGRPVLEWLKAKILKELD